MRRPRARPALLLLLAASALAALAAPAAALGCSNDPCKGHKCGAGQASFDDEREGPRGGGAASRRPAAAAAFF